MISPLSSLLTPHFPAISPSMCCLYPHVMPMLCTSEEDLEQPRGPVVVWCNPNAAYYEPWPKVKAVGTRIG